MILQTLDTVIAFALVMLLLSLMVTVLVQMVVSILGLRGRNLFFGLRQLVYAIAPDLPKEDIQSLAKMILEHPFFQAGGKRSSVEIQPKEVLAALNHLRTAGPLATPIKKTLDELFENEASSDSKLAESLDVLRSFRAGLSNDAESVDKVAGDVLSDTKEIVVKIDTWFDSAMNHAAEKFKLNTRWVTAVLAFLLAVSLQVDAPDILSQLWTNPSLTAELIVEADQIEDLFEKVYGIEDKLTKKEKEAKDLKEKLADTKGGQAAQEDNPNEKADTPAGPTDDAAETGGTETAPPGASAETEKPEAAPAADSDEAEEVPAVPPDEPAETEKPQAAPTADSAGKVKNDPEKQAVLTDQERLNLLTEQVDLAKQIRTKLFETDLKLFYTFPEGGEPDFGNFWAHLPGSLLAALLLSLGAPWWYGIIGQLVGYKSLLSAGKKEEGAK